MKLPVPLRRFTYRVGYRILQIVWLVRQPELTGVKCVITDGDLILLVRHTYGSRRWDLPGGRVAGREQPLATARREMSEELDLDVVDWTPLGQLRARIERRRDTIHLFGTELRSPALAIDRGELSIAQWFRRSELPPNLAPYASRILTLLEPHDRGA